MLRKLAAVIGALLTITALGVATSAPAQARSVVPHSGTYSGMDHGQRSITFNFHGTQMSGFKVNHHVIGGAHVSNGTWHETCHNGYCTKGHWQSDGHVVGAWRHGSGTWVAFEATVSMPPRPYVGPYLGRDHQDNPVHLRFNGTSVHGFSVNGHAVFPTAHVVRGVWHETCHDGWCFRGHWQDDYHVVGSWRTAGSVWHAWEARAYST